MQQPGNTRSQLFACITLHPFLIKVPQVLKSMVCGNLRKPEAVLMESFSLFSPRKLMLLESDQEKHLVFHP